MAIKRAEKSTHFYLREWWQVRGSAVGQWVKRGSNWLTLVDAKREAAGLAERAGKGSRVQVVRVTTEAVAEVSS